MPRDRFLSAWEVARRCEIGAAIGLPSTTDTLRLRDFGMSMTSLVVSPLERVRRFGFLVAASSCFETRFLVDVASENPLVLPIPAGEINRMERPVPFRSPTLAWNITNVPPSPCSIPAIDSGVRRRAVRLLHTETGLGVIVQVVAPVS